MSFNWRRACALVFAAALAVGVSVQAEEQAAGDQVIFDASVQPAGCNTCDTGLGLGRGVGPRGQFFIGAEYLSLRANFSEATAYRVIDPGPPATETFEQFDFNYGDSYRIYGGYRLCECGCDLTFAYSSFNSDGGFDSGSIDDFSVPGFSATAPYEVVPGADGDRLFGEADVEIDNYDIGVAKTIPLGGFCCDTGCCDTTCCDSPCGDCCDPCCGPVCAPWDLVWTGGVRFANVDSELRYFNDTATTAVAGRNATSAVSFDGVGLRTGLIGRRYFGKRGIVSGYVRGDFSLLLGEVETRVSGTTIPTTTLVSTEVVPVTEIEAGLTAWLTQNVSVSGGYLLSAWHDLGHRTEYDYGVTGTQIVSMDDANIMSLDGWFVRAEASF